LRTWTQGINRPQITTFFTETDPTVQRIFAAEFGIGEDQLRATAARFAAGEHCSLPLLQDT